MSTAACAGQPFGDFLSHRPSKVERFLALCERCDMVQACRQLAADGREKDGVWGGLRLWVAEERAQLPPPRPSPPPLEHTPARHGLDPAVRGVSYHTTKARHPEL